MIYALFENIFNGYDTSGGNTTSSTLAGVANTFPQFNFQFSGYGLDAADGDVKIQGSLDGNLWTDIVNVTLTQSTNFTIQEFVSTTEMIVTGNTVSELSDNSNFYIDGSGTNDGLYTASATQLQTRMTYSNLVGVFTVGETVTGNVTAATGIIVVDAAGAMRVMSVTGTFTNADALTGGTSGATADVDTAALVTSITTTGLTVEAAAGEIWEGSQVSLLVAQANTSWIHYRSVFTANSVTAGFLGGFGIGKSY